MNISEKIKYLRQEAGLSQSQLAQELYVSRAAVAKWENDNGIPDVENLKALAAYFGCDVDTLLDDTKQVCGFDSPKSYCGKDCVSCEEYSCNRCSGCKQGPAADYLTYCEIARCCKNQMKTACEGCSVSEDCGILRKREQMPWLRVQAEQTEKEFKAQRRVRSAFYGKWTWVLFWLFIPAYLANLITNSAVADSLAFIRIFGCVLAILTATAEGLILRHISTYEPLFKTASLCVLIGAGVDLLVLLITGTTDAKGWSYIWMVPGIFLEVARYYHEMHGYCNILRSVDHDLSEKWQTLWKLYLITNGLMVAGILLLALLKGLALLAVVIGLIGAFVVSVLLLVYKYKTAKAFRLYC